MSRELRAVSLNRKANGEPPLEGDPPFAFLSLSVDS
jgi:hypothetical protein